MHFAKVKGILSAHNGMNLYRGCLHGCIYCDSRSECYGFTHPFEDVEVKENALELLEKTLKGKRKKCMIGTGSMSDPYIPIERELLYTRKALSLISEYGFGATLITKSDDVLRDLDLFTEINQKTKCVIQMTLTTYNDELCKKIEPNVCVTSARVNALMRLKEAGIPTVVWLSPILPFINDTDDGISGILDYCIDAGVKGIICFGMGVTMREGNREYFYKCLDKLFPGLKYTYMKEYGNSYVLNSPKNNELMHLFHSKCKKNGIMHNNDEIFRYLGEFEEKNKPEQLSFL